MSGRQQSARTILFVNIAHALDHFVLLIYPTAVISIAASRGLSYAEMIGLATGTFVAFGAFALPVGWIADRVGRRNLLTLFFLGTAASCFGIAAANADWQFAVGLFALGGFAAIYHPVATAMLVSHTERLGRDLGINGVWGNLGAASASGVTAFLTAWVSWRAAFLVPGLVSLAAGLFFLRLVAAEQPAAAAARAAKPAALPLARPMLVLFVFAAALVAGGMTFNIATISLPKVIDERLGIALPLWLIGSLATAAYTVGALTQLVVGRLIERFSLAQLFVAISLMQPLGFVLAANSTGIPLLLGLVITLAALYGQVVINDGMVARYVPANMQSRAYGIRYFLGFTTSGLAVPLIALTHSAGGFPLVMGIAAGFGATIFAFSLVLLASASMPQRAAAAE